MSLAISILIYFILVFSVLLNGGFVVTQKDNTPTTSTTQTTTVPKNTPSTTAQKPKPKTTVNTVKPQPQPVETKPPVTENAAISVQGVVFFTNEARKENGVVELRVNKTLEDMALARLKDMVERDYFDHVSPIGQDITDLSRTHKYIYRFLGENLAMGDFRTSQRLVNGWMDSPGHRENILNPEYREIGVAAEYTEIMGRKQWIAVQVFGKQF